MKAIVVEDVDIQGMMRNRCLANGLRSSAKSVTKWEKNVEPMRIV